MILTNLLSVLMAYALLYLPPVRNPLGSLLKHSMDSDEPFRRGGNDSVCLWVG